MTRPKKVVAGASYMLTRRIAHRRFALRPDDDSNSIYEYCLAEAADRHHVDLHGWTMMSNHHHTVITDVAGWLPVFVGRLHVQIARGIKLLRGLAENLWSSEPVNCVRLVTPEDAFRKLSYVHANPVRADLVERAAHYTGPCSLGQHLGGPPRLVPRPRFYSSRGPLPPAMPLVARRLPGFEHLDAKEWAAKIASAVNDIEEEERERRRRTGSKVLGMERVLAASPDERPTSIEAARPHHRPMIACADRERRDLELLDLRGFQIEHREAWRRLHQGERGALFPRGSYEMRALTKPPQNDEDE